MRGTVTACQLLLARGTVSSPESLGGGIELPPAEKSYVSRHRPKAELLLQELGRLGKGAHREEGITGSAEGALTTTKRNSSLGLAVAALRPVLCG